MTGLKIEGEGECCFAPEAECVPSTSAPLYRALAVMSQNHPSSLPDKDGHALGFGHCSVPSCTVPELLLSGTHSTGMCPAKSFLISNKPGSHTSVLPP